jgi:hypothetical protein
MGTKVERVPNRNLAFLFDGKFLQIVTALKKDFLTESQKQQQMDESSTLAAHQDWETKYLETVVGEKIKVDSEKIRLSNNKDALLWSFRVPDKDQGKVKRQVFLTVVKGESILVLNGAETPTVDLDTARRFLLESVATLKISDKPLTQDEAKKLASKSN